MRIQELEIRDCQAGRSVQDLLKNELLLSEGLISRLKRRPRGICLNGKKVYTTYRVQAGDRLSAEVGDGPDFPRPEPRAYPLEVLYEDEDFLLINKPAGLAVHASTRDSDELTLENALAAYLPPDENPHPVSRLDRGTTGVMAWAKSGYAHELLRRQQHSRDYYRIYRALARGRVTLEAGTVDLPIGRPPERGYCRMVLENGAPARTDYRVLQATEEASYLELRPQTGRTHQIRVHCQALGHPLVGDWLYGKEEPELILRPALHAFRLCWRHPLTGEALVTEAPLPPDFNALLSRFKLLP
ncbi:MAG: RluA family pseudouridine synthase [Clostridia bacterium]|nr:RluA family pseudouridine synthase [Clostridia bacterium]